MKEVGFSGTRRGMTVAQRRTVRELLLLHQPAYMHHGDCIGADREFSTMLSGNDVCWIVAHPCNIESMRAHSPWNDEIREPLPPLERNKNIVNACNLLIAAPFAAKEAAHSGTWHTIRYARARKVKTIIVLPDGTIA